MSHDLVFALCSLVLLLGTVWLLVEVTHHSHDAMSSERPIQNLRVITSTRNLAAPVLSLRIPASSSGPLGGWSRIRRALRARQSVRMAVR